jgi:hypothetical protein
MVCLKILLKNLVMNVINDDIIFVHTVMSSQKHAPFFARVSWVVFEGVRVHVVRILSVASHVHSVVVYNDISVTIGNTKTLRHADVK